MAPLPLSGLLLSLALLSACGSGGERAATKGASEETKGHEEARHHGLTDEEARQVLAKVGERTITLGEFADRLAEQSPYLRARYNSPERRRELLRNMVRFELLALEAARRGIDEEPAVVEAVEQVMVEQMMKDLFTDRIRAEDITDEEVKAYYEAHRDEFHRPAHVRAAHILVQSERRARELIETLKGASPKMETFRKLAKEYSRDERTRRTGGDLGFFPAPGRGELPEHVPPEVARAAFTLERIGEVVEAPVRSKAGWHVVMLTGQRAALNRSLEEVRRTIVNRLWREKRERAIERFVDGLKQKAKVEIDEDALAQVHIDGQPPRAPDAQQPDGAASTAPQANPPRDATQRPDAEASGEGVAP